MAIQAIVKASSLYIATITPSQIFGWLLLKSLCSIIEYTIITWIKDNRHKLQSKLLVFSIIIASNQSFQSNCFFYSLFSQIRTTQAKLCLHKCGRAFLHTTKDDFYNEEALLYIGKGVEEKMEENVRPIQPTLT